ncbi:SpoIIE family protein phosphatase [Streptomyces sp. NBC_01619]|uniref:SpoIIE family protein phosphatase n=1 Tax=Streptomyces pratisoli TaxID=3139917 RepID=A0ACC6QPU0_9ACTN|nr:MULTISPECIES: SpoIIE family protein phosphatase [unclassified Streptomyces]MCX4515015.1 SpoIIE family protein phosphatase [Streptomyces sp. NBC_01619]
MSGTEAFPGDLVPSVEVGPAPPGGLLDVLGLAPVVLDAEGRIALWSQQAEELLGYTAEEALGQFALRLLVEDQHIDLVLELFSRVMESGENWAGVFPVRHKDGAMRLLEFRNMRLQDQHGGYYALGLSTDQETLRKVERDLALSVRLVDQSPIGLAVLDPDLRCITVNPALERASGLPAAQHVGRRVSETLPFLDAVRLEAAMRRVLESGTPLVDRQVIERAPADRETERAWSVSLYRLEDPRGRILGVAASVVDVTDRHHAAKEAERARHRLALVADASMRIGTTLDLWETARELADVAVPELADIAAVDVLDSAVEGRRESVQAGGTAVFRALAVAAAYPTVAVQAADPPGDITRYEADRLVTRCVQTGEPIVVPHVANEDLPGIARDASAAVLLAAAGVHSYLAVPLIARGEVLGALDLKRFRNPLPFDADDVVLASELAGRAAVCIDNARWYQQQRNAALALQRSLLPRHPPHLVGLEVASRYQPAGSVSEVGGDWFDILPLNGDKTALVVGDVMGSGINAATAMGRLRTATQTLASLGLDPERVLHQLDAIAGELEPYIATCLYALYDPHEGRCSISTAGHLPPVLLRPGEAPVLLDLPTGVPLGVGGVDFHAVGFDLAPGDTLVLYTDGLVETRDQDIDTRLHVLLTLLSEPPAGLEDTCDLLLESLRQGPGQDDVALLIARVLG